MIEQNYLNYGGNNLNDIIMASESISYSDIVYKRIWQDQDFSLSNSHSFFSTVYPTKCCNGFISFLIIPRK
jgi:hypothetical protein